jgi:hypothetical protein
MISARQQRQMTEIATIPNELFPINAIRASARVAPFGPNGGLGVPRAGAGNSPKKVAAASPAGLSRLPQPIAER